MIIGMRGHDFGRMPPVSLAAAIEEAGFAATQLAFTKAFPAPASDYMTPDALRQIRNAFEIRGIAIPVMGCYISASDRDDSVREAALTSFCSCLHASVMLGAGCVGTETTHFTFDESEREAAYARLLDFSCRAVREAEACGAIVGIEPVATHTLHTPEMTQRLVHDVSSDHLKIVLDLANLIPPGESSPAFQAEMLERSLHAFGDRIAVLHIKDGVWSSEGRWVNRPLGQGIMNWAHLLPRLRAHNDTLCALREDVWPGLAAQECSQLHRWLGE